MYKNKKISVIGLGISGISAINFLAKNGAKIFVSEFSSSSANIKKLQNSFKT